MKPPYEINSKIFTVKTIKFYFVSVTLFFLVSSLFGSKNISAYSPIFYGIIGPTFLFGLHYRLVFNFSSYVDKNAPDLMKKHSISYGILKGNLLNILDVYQSQKAFKALKDERIDAYLQTGILLLKLVIASFVMLIVMGILSAIF